MLNLKQINLSLCRILTDIWHPNIEKDGKVCISILHEPGGWLEPIAPPLALAPPLYLTSYVHLPNIYYVLPLKHYILRIEHWVCEVRALPFGFAGRT